MEPSVTLHAPAKLNLTLEILNRRDDGLHNLRSVMVPVALFDTIEIRPGTTGLQFSCDDPQLEAGNLVVRALEALQLPSHDLSISLKKAIPIGAGLGGGSSDAAAVLLAAMNGRLGAIAPHDFLSIARSLGSDVPFFFAGTAALVEGTGERVTALGAVPAWQVVIVQPPLHIQTASAYAALAGTARESRPRSASMTLALGEALQRADRQAVIELLHNDFQATICQAYPPVAQALEALAAFSGSRALLTGSGSCVFTLTDRTDVEAIDLPEGFRRIATHFVHSANWRTA